MKPQILNYLVKLKTKPYLVHPIELELYNELIQLELVYSRDRQLILTKKGLTYV